MCPRSTSRRRVARLEGARNPGARSCAAPRTSGSATPVQDGRRSGGRVELAQAGVAGAHRGDLPSAARSGRRRSPPCAAHPTATVSISTPPSLRPAWPSTATGRSATSGRCAARRRDGSSASASATPTASDRPDQSARRQRQRERERQRGAGARCQLRPMAAAAGGLVLGDQQAGLRSPARPTRRGTCAAAPRHRRGRAARSSSSRVGRSVRATTSTTSPGSSGSSCLPQRLGAPVQVRRARDHGVAGRLRRFGASIVPRQSRLPQRHSNSLLELRRVTARR